MKLFSPLAGSVEAPEGAEQLLIGWMQLVFAQQQQQQFNNYPKGNRWEQA